MTIPSTLWAYCTHPHAYTCTRLLTKYIVPLYAQVDGIYVDSMIDFDSTVIGGCYYQTQFASYTGFAYTRTGETDVAVGTVYILQLIHEVRSLATPPHRPTKVGSWQHN